MQFLQGRHPEIAMWLALPIEPRRPSFLSSHTQEIGPCVAPWRAICFFIAAVADVSFKWPGQTHLCFIFSSVPEKQGQKGNKSFVDERPNLIPRLQPSCRPADAVNCFALQDCIGLF